MKPVARIGDEEELADLAVLVGDIPEGYHVARYPYRRSRK
jgi:hypothetical protein